MIEKSGFVFHGIYAGKLRRYLSWHNFIDVILIFVGFCQSWILLSKLQPSLVFAKGGYVTMPLAIAAWLKRIPIVIHESDSIPGLSNRLLGKLAKVVMIAMPSVERYFEKSKIVLVGSPIRRNLLVGDKNRGLKFLDFNNDLPILMIIGGSQGALGMNQFLEKLLPLLIKEWQIVHITGAGKGNEFRHKNYRTFDVILDELGDVLAACDLAITRAGANVLTELANWGIPAIIFPLPGSANDHQQLNADFYTSSGAAFSFNEKSVDASMVTAAINDLRHSDELRGRMGKAMKSLAKPEAAANIARLILKLTLE